MANICFLYDDTFDDLTTSQVTSYSEVTTLPSINVFQQFVGKVWRGTTSQFDWLKFNVGTTVSVGQVALFGHNFTDDATVVLQARSTDGTTLEWNAAAAWSTPIAIGNGKGNVFFSTQAYPWWRIRITDSGNTEDLEVGRVKIGAKVEFSQNYRQGWERERFDPSESDEAEGLQRYYNVRDKGWRLRMGWNYTDSTAQSELETMFEAVGNHTPFVVNPNPADHPLTWTHYVELRTPLSMAMALLDYADVGELDFEEAF